MKTTIKDPATGEYHEVTEVYSPALLDDMRENPSRERTTMFIRHYYAAVKQNKTLPSHWHQFAADILFNAQEALNVDYETHKGPLANVMWLQGQKGTVSRDTAIALAIQQELNALYNPLLTQPPYGAVKDAKSKVHERLRALDIGMSVIDKAWKNRNQAGVILWGGSMPDFDFLSVIQ